jgi:Domain of unknown function (DUF4395)
VSVTFLPHAAGSDMVGTVPDMSEFVGLSLEGRTKRTSPSSRPLPRRPDLDSWVFVILSEVKRRADPYRDLEVIDSRAPRLNQATIGLLAALAVATGSWWLLGALGLQLLVGLTLGRRFCLPCLAYFELVQPRFGEGTLEDARPPRFANLVGAVFLTAATVAYAAGLATLGAVLGGIVAALALLAAGTGFCTGCEAYKLGSFLLGRPFVSCPLPPRVN